MTKRTTKSDLLMSALALVLCVSMLIGSTFAWFTDSVSNGVNKIVSGNLDIELWHCLGSDTQYGFGYDEAKGEQVNESTLLFLNADGEEMLWEPGASVGETFRVKNVGSLALKFQFRIDTSNVTETAEGKDLTDVLSIQVVEFEYVNGVPVNGGGVWYEDQLGEGYIIEDVLLPGETLDYYVSIDWIPSDVDNDYNVEGGLSVDLGITLMATQFTYEVDGWDDQYDAGAGFAIVNPTMDLEQVIESAESGSTIYVAPGVYELDGDIQIVNKNLTIIGMGYVELVGAPGLRSAHMIYIANGQNGDYKEDMTVTIKNVHLDGRNTFKKAGIWLRNDATVNLENVSSKNFGWDEIQVDTKSGADNGEIPAGVKAIINMKNVKAEVVSADAAANNSVYFNYEDSEFALLKKGQNPENVYFNEDNAIPSIIGVSTAAELTSAASTAVDGSTIILLKDIKGNATITQRPGIDLVVDGNGKKYDGTIYVHGGSHGNSSETLVIENINFTTSTYVENFAFVDSNSADAGKRYAHNVTVKNCTFKATGEAVHKAVGVRLRQTYNYSVIGGKAYDLHSILWSAGSSNIVINGIEGSNIKNGVSIEGDTSLTLKNTKIESTGIDGYGLRVNATATSSVTVEDCDISAVIPVLIRKATGTYAVTMSGANTLTAGNADGYQIMVTNTDYDKTYAAPTGTGTFVGFDGFNVK